MTRQSTCIYITLLICRLSGKMLKGRRCACKHENEDGLASKFPTDEISNNFAVRGLYAIQ